MQFQCNRCKQTFTDKLLANQHRCLQTSAPVYSSTFDPTPSFTLIEDAPPNGSDGGGSGDCSS